MYRAEDRISTLFIGCHWNTSSDKKKIILKEISLECYHFYIDTYS